MFIRCLSKNELTPIFIPTHFRDPQNVQSKKRKRKNRKASPDCRQSSQRHPHGEEHKRKSASHTTPHQPSRPVGGTSLPVNRRTQECEKRKLHPVTRIPAVSRVQYHAPPSQESHQPQMRALPPPELGHKPGQSKKLPHSTPGGPPKRKGFANPPTQPPEGTSEKQGSLARINMDWPDPLLFFVLSSEKGGQLGDQQMYSR